MAERTTKNAIFAEPWLSQALADIGAATPPLNGLAGSTIHLFTGALAPSINTPVADFQAAEATFTGYGPATAATWNTFKIGANAWALFEATLFLISGGPPVTGDEITGYWVEDDLGNLVMSERFGESVNLQIVGDFLDLNVMIPMNLTITLPDPS